MVYDPHMAHRPNVYVSKIIPCDGGESPNRYVPHITVEIRVFAPPHTPAWDVYRALGDAAVEASQGVAERWA